MADKVFKKLYMGHGGSLGSYTIDWYTENASGTFTIDLASNPAFWSSFFPSTAMGLAMRLRISKSDLYDFRLNEVKGAYAPEPIII